VKCYLAERNRRIDIEPEGAADEPAPAVATRSPETRAKAADASAAA
jgi:hypothetical protein